MNILAEVSKQLDSLAHANHGGAGVLQLGDNQLTLRCRIKSIDRLACELESCQLSSRNFGGLTGDSLHELADQLAHQLSYLEEKLTVVESDPELVQAQLRSQEPNSIIPNKKTYFELLVGATGLKIQRYEKRVKQPRRIVAAVLSKSILGRLCKDLFELEI